VSKLEEVLAERTVLQTQLEGLNEKIVALEQIETIKPFDIIGVVLYCTNNNGIKIQYVSKCESDKLKATITEILKARVADV